MFFSGEFEDGNGQTVNFDIQDVGADYAVDFPPMWHLSVKSADAFIIVFSLNDAATWEEVYRLRDLVIDQKVLLKSLLCCSDVMLINDGCYSTSSFKDPEVPIVIVANKSDMEHDPDLPYESLEATSIFDLENGYVECSAKEKKNIKKIFKELLNQGKPRFDLCMPSSSGNRGEESPAGQPYEGGACGSNYVLHRRQSLPSAPAGLPFQATNLPYKIDEEERSHESPEESKPRKTTQRRSSISALRRDSCRVS